ncbi:MAG: hypothetical protein AABX38_03290 [Candidatus Micrarchaeota archaeon]
MGKLLLEHILNLEQLPDDAKERILSRVVATGSVDKLVDALKRVYVTLSNYEFQSTKSLVVEEQIVYLTGVTYQIFDALHKIDPKNFQKMDILCIAKAIVTLYPVINMDSGANEKSYILHDSLTYLFGLVAKLDNGPNEPSKCKIDRLSDIPEVVNSLQESILFVEDEYDKLLILRDLIQKIADTAQSELKTRKEKLSKEEYLIELKMLFAINRAVLEFRDLVTSAMVSIESALSEYVSQGDFAAAFKLAKKMETSFAKADGSYIPDTPINPTDHVLDLIVRQRNALLFESGIVYSGINSLVELLEQQAIHEHANHSSKKSQLELLIPIGSGLDIPTKISLLKKLAESAHSEEVLRALDKIDLTASRDKVLVSSKSDNTQTSAFEPIVLRAVIDAKEQLLGNIQLSDQLFEIPQIVRAVRVTHQTITSRPPPIPGSESRPTIQAPNGERKPKVLRA